MRILIVEDEAIPALELRLTLTEAGHEVIGVAVDLPSALELLRRPIDLALVDLNLRDGPTGREIAAEVMRSQGALVVFLTANPDQLPPGLDGALGLLVKPYDPAVVPDLARFAAGVGAREPAGRLPAGFVRGTG